MIWKAQASNLKLSPQLGLMSGIRGALFHFWPRDNEMMMTAMMMTTNTMSALKITAMTMMTVEWRAPADGSIGGAAQPQPRSQEMSPLFLLLSSSSPLLTTIIIIVITIITIFTFLPSSPICKFVNWYNLKKMWKQITPNTLDSLRGNSKSRFQ